MMMKPIDEKADTVVEVRGAHDFNAEIADHRGVTIADFWAGWCGPCKMLAPVLDEVAEESGGALKVVKVDVDANADLAQRFAVRSLPTLVFFRDGDEVDRLVGSVPKNAILDRVERLATVIKK